MSSNQPKDENYIKLAQIYQILKTKDSASKIIHIKAILENDFDVNYKLPLDSFVCRYKPQYSGNTALHFLIEFSFDNYQSLLDLFISYEADFTIQNVNGFSPLLLTFDKQLKQHSTVYDLLSLHIKKKDFRNVKCKNGISHFHVACSTNYVEVVDLFLKAGVSTDERVNDDSPKYSGYTPLHFAMQHKQYQTIELLLNNGANLNIKDAKGMTPFHLFIKFYKSYDCEYLVKMHSNLLSNNIGFTNLHFGFISYTDCLNQQTDINSLIQFDSPVWPGYTPLHVAAQFSLQTTIFLLKKGANLLAKDANGTSSFDLCLKYFNINEIIQILLAEKLHLLSELKLMDGTRLLDVLEAMSDLEKLKQFMKKKIKNVNVFMPVNSPIFPGYNLLHLSVILNKFTDFLLSCNVDFTKLNAEGLTSLHLAFYLANKGVILEILDFYEKIPVNCIDRNNLSDLHIACIMKHRQAVKFLLNNGSDPNLPLMKDIKCNFNLIDEPYFIKTGSTPFLISATWIDEDLTNLFLSRGADINAADADGKTPFEAFFNVFYYSQDVHRHRIVEDTLYWMLQPEMGAVITTDMCYKILSDLPINEKCKYNKMINEFIKKNSCGKLGLTKLQIICAMSDTSTIIYELEDDIKNKLITREDINRHIDFNSALWPGDTSMHILFRKNIIDTTADLLLKHGADITIKNVDNLTPLHLLDWNNESEKEILLLLSEYKLTSVNPMNNEGLSHFHLCCKTNNNNNKLVIEEFLKSGVDINAQIDHFADHNAGYTPIHFAIEYGSIDIVNLLLKYGADPNIKTTNGFTSLHLAVSFPSIDHDKVEILLRSSTVDSQSKNIIGETVFETALKNTVNPKDKTNIDERIICLFLEKNIHLDYLDLKEKFFPNFDRNYLFELSTTTFMRLIGNIRRLTDDVDEEGQNILHHVSLSSVKNTYNYFKKIEILVQRGCEVNYKDSKGKTPLHLVCSWDNERIKHLLQLGADVNIKDDDGKTPLVNVFNNSLDQSIKYFFCYYLKDLEEIGLYVNELNKSLVNNFNNQNPFIVNTTKKELQKILKKLHLSFSADYFFSDKFVIDYRRMPVRQRKAICCICDSYSYTNVFITLQLSKARARTRLLEPATIKIQFLIGFGLPLLCIECILDHLNNDDLMNLIRFENGMLELAPLPENC